MDWNARVRVALVGAEVPDDDVISELAQHAEAAYEAALGERLPEKEAVARVDEQVAEWRRAASDLVRPRKRTRAVDPPRPGARGLAAIPEELRQAACRLRREPGHSALVALTLPVGISATTLLFSVVDGVLLSPLPWPNAGRLVRLAETREGATREWPWRVTNGSYLALRDGARSEEGLAAWQGGHFTLAGEGRAERVAIPFVTASLFPLLEARPLMGRVFAASDEAAGRVVVLSYGLWQRRFGGRPEVIGRPVRLDGRLFRVIGAMPHGFALPDREASAWVPLHVRPGGITLLRAMARLRPDASADQLTEEATRLARHAPDPGLVTMAVQLQAQQVRLRWRS